MKEIGPSSFVLIAFLIMFTFLLKIIRDERKVNKDELVHIKAVQYELSKKIDEVKSEVSLLSTMIDKWMDES